jgi:hypothetical protein
VKTPVDAQLQREAETFAFRFACDDCVHFEPASAACSLSFEAAPRRDALARTYLELCKAFELA